MGFSMLGCIAYLLPLFAVTPVVEADDEGTASNGIDIVRRT